jgi:transcriptional regulator with XRE-family HTH domain
MATTMTTPVNSPVEIGNSKRRQFSRVANPQCRVINTIRELGVTQIARDAGLTRNYVSMVLNGTRKPAYDALRDIARACRCSVGQLVEYLDRQYAARESMTA